MEKKKILTTEVSIVQAREWFFSGNNILRELALKCYSKGELYSPGENYDRILEEYQEKYSIGSFWKGNFGELIIIKGSPYFDKNDNFPMICDLCIPVLSYNFRTGDELSIHLRISTNDENFSLLKFPKLETSKELNLEIFKKEIKSDLISSIRKTESMVIYYKEEIEEQEKIKKRLKKNLKNMDSVFDHYTTDKKD